MSKKKYEITRMSKTPSTISKINAALFNYDRTQIIRMSSFIFGPLASTSARTSPTPLSSSHPADLDLASISSHQGKRRSRAISLNHGVNELAADEQINVSNWGLLRNEGTHKDR